MQNAEPLQTAKRYTLLVGARMFVAHDVRYVWLVS